MSGAMDRPVVRGTRRRGTAWGPIVVLAVVAGLLGYRWFTADQTVDDQSRVAIREWVLLELQHDWLERGDLTTPERAAALISVGDIVLASVQIRGSPDDAVARVEVAPDARFPAETPLERYFHLRRGPAGWMVMGDATATAFYLAFL
jgi:hypothetical protein